MINHSLNGPFNTNALKFTLNSWISVLTALLLLFLPVGYVTAHHSAGMFDRDQRIETQAVVKEFEWTYPHIWIQVNITNSENIVEEWSIEGGVPSHLYRRGWRPGTFKAGDNITIVFNPMGDGGKAGLFVGAILADGNVIGNMESNQ
jgi:hypothetical protein